MLHWLWLQRVPAQAHGLRIPYTHVYASDRDMLQTAWLTHLSSNNAPVRLRMWLWEKDPNVVGAGGGWKGTKISCQIASGVKLHVWSGKPPRVKECQTHPCDSLWATKQSYTDLYSLLTFTYYSQHPPQSFPQPGQSRVKFSQSVRMISKPSGCATTLAMKNMKMREMD